jgi:PAT family beta-lactamase induction signal transducer AmpG
MASPSSPPSHPWRWIPTLYFAQGIPYVVVMTLSVVMYKNLKVSNTDIALYTSWLYLPWVIKPLWSPLVDLFRTKRWWIVSLQFVLGAALALIALTLPGPDFFRYSLAVLLADGLQLGDARHRRRRFLPAGPAGAPTGRVRRRAQHLLPAGDDRGPGRLGLSGRHAAELTGDVARAWTWVFVVLAGFFLLAALYHLAALPRPASDGPAPRGAAFTTGYVEVFAAFFRKKGIGLILTYLLVYRLAEAQLLKLVTPFLLDERAVGGLGLTTQQVGLVYGTIGIIALTLGGLAGGYVISRFGLKRLLWPMIITMHAPIAVFLYLAAAQPAHLGVIGAALAVEQFGYGFGFTAYMVYMMLVADGEHKTAHYALCTGFMALGMMLPGMAAGWIQDHLGYPLFFLWVCAATLPSFAATVFLKVDPAFGKKS